MGDESIDIPLESQGSDWLLEDGKMALTGNPAILGKYVFVLTLVDEERISKG